MRSERVQFVHVLIILRGFRSFVHVITLSDSGKLAISQLNAGPAGRSRPHCQASLAVNALRERYAAARRFRPIRLRPGSLDSGADRTKGKYFEEACVTIRRAVIAQQSIRRCRSPI